MSRESKATKEEIQRNRDEAYQNGWSDGYAEGYGKAIAALPAQGVDAISQAEKRGYDRGFANALTGGAVAPDALHRSFPEAGDGRPLPPMGDELMTAGLNAEDARFVAVQLAQNGWTLAPAEAGGVEAHPYSLRPDLQRIVDNAKTAPHWDTERDRLAHAPVDALVKAAEAMVKRGVVNQDECGGCVECGSTGVNGGDYGYAGEADEDHEPDCPYIMLRAALAAYRGDAK